jgi:hypothetical protein
MQMKKRLRCAAGGRRSSILAQGRRVMGTELWMVILVTTVVVATAFINIVADHFFIALSRIEYA